MRPQARYQAQAEDRVLQRPTTLRNEEPHYATLEVAYVEKVSAHLPVSWPSPAARLPAHATALGKALLAFAPPSQLRAVLAQGLTQYTPRTVTRPERLQWGLQSIRVTRIAMCDRELHPDWCAVAAPVIGAGGEAVAAIELQVRGLALDVPMVKAPLVVASACFSRELLQSGCLCTARRGLLAATV
jgi:IclR family acetate operon transcriptional repressor